MKLNKILIKSSSTKCGQLLTEAIKDNDLRALQRDMNRTILLLVMLFLMLGVVEQLKAVDSKNSFENAYNAPKYCNLKGSSPTRLMKLENA